MCGISGVVDYTGADASTLTALAARMNDTLAHRGPDGAGVWLDLPAGVALAQRRLAIVDLSPAGAQPMQDHAGRFCITLNGEIYNYEALRAQLPGRAWRGHSDTEVLLEAIAAWGLEAALGRTVGMFAFALWDRRERVLTLARDRFGEKPLYYGAVRGAFLFASELPALAAHPAFAGRIDRSALDQFLRLGCVPSPRTIYEGVYKLPPACTLTLALGSGPAVGAAVPQTGPSRTAVPQPAAPQAYWSLAAIAAQPALDLGEDEVLAYLEQLLLASIAGQMVADVPVGAFLSGGIDSSLAVALMQARAGRRVKTFSIGFADAAYDEAGYAQAVANHLGTDHTAIQVSAREAMEVIPSLPAMYGEPFADSSQIPTHLVARLARQQVTVSLSGDGADELFGGYNRHVLAARHATRLERTPWALRRVAAHALQVLPPAMWDRALRTMLGARAPVRPGEKVHKAAAVLAEADLAGFYRSLVSTCDQPLALLAEAPAPAWPLAGQGAAAARMMLSDALGYLPDDILVKVDRAAMAVSLETRAPYLDHRVAEFAVRLPLDFKLRHGRSKWPLRALLRRYVPDPLVERPKQGFGVPLDAWLRGPLKPWAADLLDAGRLQREGYLDAGRVRALWDAHQSGRRDVQHALWNVLMFQAWLQSRPRP